MQKARGHPEFSGLPPIVGAWFQVLFTPLHAVLFTFPSRYLFAIGLPVVLSLARWCWRIQTGFLRPRPTQGSGSPIATYAYGTLTLFGGVFQTPSASSQLTPCRPYNPRVHAHGFGLTRFRSPLLAGSLFCFPFLRVLRCFSSPGRSPPYGECHVFNVTGCPIRTPTDQGLFATPRGFSQLTASFVIPGSQGILHAPLLASCPLPPPPGGGHPFRCRAPLGTPGGAFYRRPLVLSSPILVNELLCSSAPYQLACGHPGNRTRQHASPKPIPALFTGN